MKGISCQTAYGLGGLGQHLKQVAMEATEGGQAVRCYCVSDENQPFCIEVAHPAARYVFKTPVSYFTGWRSYMSAMLFDRAVAGVLEPAEAFTGFVGQALSTFQKARKMGCRELELQAANSHVDNVLAKHAQARKQWQLEGSWLNEAQAVRTRKEYDMADRIVVASEYSRKSFLERGIAPERLHRIRLHTNPRFQPPAAHTPDGVFRVVYVGSVTVYKGVPLLLEAFSRLQGQTELTLVGGYGSRGMNRCMGEWMQRDARIRLAPGDPLPHLHKADVCVHPSWEDGWAYSAAEALASGVPMVVSEDTGMKELVKEGVNGYVVPTGKWEPILERLEYLRSHPLKSLGSLENIAK